MVHRQLGIAVQKKEHGDHVDGGGGSGGGDGGGGGGGGAGGCGGVGGGVSVEIYRLVGKSLPSNQHLNFSSHYQYTYTLYSYAVHFTTMVSSSQEVTHGDNS